MKKAIELSIWPESAWPYLIKENLKQDYPLGHPWKILPQNINSALLFGSLVKSKQGKIFNSALLLGRDGNALGRFDKIDPLPFIEDLSFPFITSFIDTKKHPHITNGNNSPYLDLNGKTMAVMICSEEFYPQHISKKRFEKADYLVSLVNDVWLDHKYAKRQHLAFAVYAAIIHRKFLYRSTNFGYSALISPLGVIQRKLRQNRFE